MNMDFISHHHSHCISVTAEEILRLVAEEWGTRCDGGLWWEDGETGWGAVRGWWRGAGVCGWGMQTEGGLQDDCDVLPRWETALVWSFLLQALWQWMDQAPGRRDAWWNPPSSQPSPAQPPTAGGRGLLNWVLTPPTWIPPAMEILVLSQRTQPRALVPQQTFPSAARSPTCPQVSSLLLPPVIVPTSLAPHFPPCKPLPSPFLWVVCLLLGPLSFYEWDISPQSVTDKAFENQPPLKQNLAAAFRCRVGAEICTFPITTTGSTC